MLRLEPVLEKPNFACMEHMSRTKLPIATSVETNSATGERDELLKRQNESL